MNSQQPQGHSFSKCLRPFPLGNLCPGNPLTWVVTRYQLYQDQQVLCDTIHVAPMDTFLEVFLSFVCLFAYLLVFRLKRSCGRTPRQ